MAADIGNMHPVRESGGHGLRRRRYRCSCVAAGAMVALLALAAWAVRGWNLDLGRNRAPTRGAPTTRAGEAPVGAPEPRRDRADFMDDTTTVPTTPRSTMVRFLSAYHSLFLMHYLPFPVRKEPIGDRPSRVNGSGKPLYSWRVEVAGVFPVCPARFSLDLSQPWDSPANHDLMLWDDCFSADKTPRPNIVYVKQQKSFPQTVMLAIVGPGTAFADNRTRAPLKGIPPGAVLLVESRASGIPWPAPGDFDIRTMPHTINAPDGSGISGQNPGGFVVLFADGQAWFLSEKVPFGILAKFFTVESAKRHSREELLGPFLLDGLTGGGYYPAGEVDLEKLRREKKAGPIGTKAGPETKKH